MKLPHLPSLLLLSLTTLVALLATQTSADEWSGYRATCARKTDTLVAAIDKFCAAGNIVMPSDYAARGQGVGASYVYVTPSPYCLRTGRVGPANPVWIPAVWCRRQMYETCAKGAPNGWGSRIYGGRGCQRFVTVPG